MHEVDNIKTNFKDSPYYLYINSRWTYSLYSNQQVTLNVINEIKRQIENTLKFNNLKSCMMIKRLKVQNKILI